MDLSSTTFVRAAANVLDSARFAAISLATLVACAHPAWFPIEPHVVRASAHDRFLVAAGEGRGAGRELACEAAHAAAFADLVALLLREMETRSDVVAAAGGPSRFPRAMESFALRDGARAQRTRVAYDDAGDRCWVELRWLLPRELAAAVRRALDGQATELEVGIEMERALQGAERARAAPRTSAAPTPTAAVSAAYPGWFMRPLAVEGCATHVVVFVGSPGGTESRWLELRRGPAGWLIVGDERTANDGWPAPPRIPSCD